MLLDIDFDLPLPPPRRVYDSIGGVQSALQPLAYLFVPSSHHDMRAFSQGRHLWKKILTAMHAAHQQNQMPAGIPYRRPPLGKKVFSISRVKRRIAIGNAVHRHEPFRYTAVDPADGKALSGHSPTGMSQSGCHVTRRTVIALDNGQPLRSAQERLQMRHLGLCPGELFVVDGRQGSANLVNNFQSLRWGQPFQKDQEGFNLPQLRVRSPIKEGRYAL